MSPHDELIAVLHDGKELGLTYDEIDEIIKALERAKKMEELLGLYRERKELQNYRGEHPEEYYEVDDKIEVLEEELK